MGVHDAENRKPPVSLANDAASHNLARTVKLHMSHSGISLGSRWESSQYGGFLCFANAEEDPTGFLLAAGPRLMFGVFLEQGSADALGQENALERQGLRPCPKRMLPDIQR